MITINYNTSSKPTIPVVALSSVPDGKFVQFLSGNFHIGTKLTIPQFKRCSNGFVQALVLEHLKHNLTAVNRIYHSHESSTRFLGITTLSSDSPVVVYEHDMDIELSLAFK
jgi:hypothetical protein